MSPVTAGRWAAMGSATSSSETPRGHSPRPRRTALAYTPRPMRQRLAMYAAAATGAALLLAAVLFALARAG
jgi:hypothetical protein